MTGTDEFLAALPESPPPDGWRLETTRSGHLAAFIGDRALCSRFDPLREAETLAEGVPEHAGIVVLAGYGLGYLAEALLRLRPGKPLIVAEADPGLLRAALTARRPVDIEGRGEIAFLTAGNPEAIQDLLTPATGGGPIHFIRYRPVQDLYPGWYDALDRVVRDTAARREVNARTLDRFGRLWVRNMAFNTAPLARGLSIDSYKNRLMGIPALVLAGGPSLEEILPYLPDLRERALVLSVDTALPAVLRTGIEPDIVAAVDPQYWNTRHLDRCRCGAPVLAEVATHPRVFRILEGRPWLTRSRFPLGGLLEDAAGLRGSLRAGGSVATAAWDLARHLGCRPLYSAGLDLGYPGRKTHYAGSLSRERPHYGSQRTKPVEDAGWRALTDARPYPAPGANGGTVLTDRRMAIYAAWFRERAAEFPDTMPKTLGSGGLAIPGIAVAEEGEWRRHPPRRREIAAFITELSSAPLEKGAPGRIRDAMEGVRKAVMRIENVAEKGVRAAHDLRTALRENQDLAPSLKDMDGVDTELLSIQGRDVVSFLIQPIIREISEPAENTDPPTVALQSLRLYEELRESARYHRILFSQREK